jgi:hypothetical protein
LAFFLKTNVAIIFMAKYGVVIWVKITHIFSPFFSSFLYLNNIGSCFGVFSWNQGDQMSW